ncbi:MAG TPA: metalloregulator ArsR/SmtB family transcription factor [Thermoanaerobaculaceae bacterium]|nr:metalloregulator ArsR/SmtB family transcription factor [Thermoanaerobaculaceae bacterium]
MTTPLASAVDVHKALAHPARLRILAMLRGGELCVCQLIAVVRSSPSTVSAHLTELRRAGLVAERKVGKWVHVRLAESGQAGDLLRPVFAGLADDPQLAADAALLERLRGVELIALTRAGRDPARLGIAVCCPPARAREGE